MSSPLWRQISPLYLVSADIVRKPSRALRKISILLAGPASETLHRSAIHRSSWDRLVRSNPGSLSKGALNRRWRKTTELALDHPGERDRRTVLEVAADNLHADRQAVIAVSDRHRGRRQPVRCRDAGPCDLVAEGHVLAVDVELSGLSRSVIVWEAHGRHRRAQHDINFLEQRLPG